VLHSAVSCVRGRTIRLGELPDVQAVSTAGPVCPADQCGLQEDACGQQAAGGTAGGTAEGGGAVQGCEGGADGLVLMIIAAQFVVQQVFSSKLETLLCSQAMLQLQLHQCDHVAWQSAVSPP